MAKKRIPRTLRAPKKADDWKKFIEVLQKCGNVSDACRRTGIGRTTANDRRRDIEAFASEWSNALEIAADRLEKEADRRASRGTTRLLLHKGSPVVVDAATGEHLPGYIPMRDKHGNETGFGYLTERQYSDTLLIFLLKGARPDKFADRRKVDAHHSGEVGLAVSKSLAEEIAAARSARGIDAGHVPEEPGE